MYHLGGNNSTHQKDDDDGDGDKRENEREKMMKKIRKLTIEHWSAT